MQNPHRIFNGLGGKCIMKSPLECPMAGSSPVAQASVYALGARTLPDIAGSAVPVRVRPETVLRRNVESSRCLPDPLPPPLYWTSPVARLPAECPVDRPYRREA